jgi:hypothetical protein
VVEATGDIVWRCAELNESIILESGKTLPQYLLDSLNETRAGLKGSGNDANWGRVSKRERGTA